MKQIVIVANLAATFGGNFIQSMKALQASDTILICYILPQGAKDCDWIPELTEVYYTNWSLEFLRKMWKKFNQEQKGNIVHFHFVGEGEYALRCKFIFSLAGKMIWYLHNHIGRGSGQLTWLKDLAKRYIYHDSYKIGVSNSVADSMRFYSPKHVATYIMLWTLIVCRGLAKTIILYRGFYIEDSSEEILCMVMGNHHERKEVDIAAKVVSC